MQSYFLKQIRIEEFDRSRLRHVQHVLHNRGRVVLRSSIDDSELRFGKIMVMDLRDQRYIYTIHIANCT